MSSPNRASGWERLLSDRCMSLVRVLPQTTTSRWLAQRSIVDLA